MQYPIDTCPIWGKGRCLVIPLRFGENVVYRVEDSPRRRGGYELWGATRDRVGHLADTEKAWLTTWLIDQRRNGIQSPRVTRDTLAYIRNKGPLPVHERAERLLQCIAEQAEAVGTAVSIDQENLATYAWTESTRWDDVRYFVDYLIAKELIRDITVSGNRRCVVTVDGYSRIGDQATNLDSSKRLLPCGSVTRWTTHMSKESKRVLKQQVTRLCG